MKVIFFDAGETILHPHPSFSEIFAEVCRSAGHDVSPADVERVQSRLAPHLMDLDADDEDEHARPYAGSAFSETESRRFWTYLYRRFIADLGLVDQSLPERLFERFSDTATYKLFDDVLPALHGLRDAGFRLGLISNFERWLEELLVELEVGHLFDAVTISGVAGVEKPDTEIFELALREAGVDARDAVHVGDSPSMDAEPASSVGMQVVLLDRADRYAELPWTRIRSLEELQATVSNM